MRLALEDVAIARGGRTLLHGITASFEAGEVVGILGSNGVGKTSLLATMAGTLAPARGSVRIDGKPISTLDPRTRAKHIAFVETTESVLGAMTVEEAVSSARFPHHRWWEWQPTAEDGDAVDAALERVSLAPFRTRQLGTLSAGERQRVWIAIAIAQRAQIALLDEPTSHLDLRHAVETLELARSLAERGTLVICVLHLLEEAATFCDRVLVLGEEAVLADGPPLTALRSDTLERAYGIAVEVECRAEGLAFHRRRKKQP